MNKQWLDYNVKLIQDLREKIFGKEQDCDELEYKLTKTLTEIKEIAEELKKFYEELGKCESLTVAQLKQILQKISEVIDE